ncbi:sce7726 family protein [Moritella viscosa]|uniref:sce7726 family protein n=1 Tax=Moritella viscosa TaxID=80854 RepID=UPI0009191683|nr:sce7726 family protein [Moritella viscosa]SGZ08238.1 Putative uncharacterized protein [Moritella viscosa]
MNHKNLAKLFTSADISKVAQGDLRTVSSLQQSFNELASLDTLVEIYDEAYKLLCTHYPNEYVLKNTIANNILIGTHSMNTASMLSELRIGTNRADCVIINGISTCYEIKTQFDSLKRLPEQLKAYTSAFDKTIVVTHEKHLDALYKIHEEMPIFGIKVANKKGRLSDKVIAPLNTNFDTSFMFHSLRLEEYTNIAKTILGNLPEMPNTKIFQFCKDLFCSLPAHDANKLFKENLKYYRKNDHNFINMLPKSMKNIGISYNLSSKSKNNIIDSLLGEISQNQGDMNVLPIFERQAV